MPSLTKQRTIAYLRAIWPEGKAGSTTLQEALLSCLARLPTTTVDLRDGRAEVRHKRDTGRHLYLHVAAWTDREPMSAVPHRPGLQDLSAVRPGDDWDYLDGDGMFLISGNDCLLLPSGLHPKTMEQYLKNLLEEAGPAFEEARRFLLGEVAAPDVARRVCEDGVKSIDLNLSQYLETALDDRRRETIVERLGLDILRDLVTKEEDRRRMEEAENVSARLTISLDTRRKGLKPEEFAPIVREITEDSPEDAVEIVTKSGERIRRGALVSKKPVKITAFAKTVDHHHAWEEMTRYFDELVDSGRIEA